MLCARGPRPEVQGPKCAMKGKEGSFPLHVRFCEPGIQNHDQLTNSSKLMTEAHESGIVGGINPLHRLFMQGVASKQRPVRYSTDREMEWDSRQTAGHKKGKVILGVGQYTIIRRICHGRETC